MLVIFSSIVLVLPGHHCVLGVVWLRNAQKSLQGEQGRANGECGRPLVLENVEADGPSLGGNVGVPDFSIEFHLGRLVGVLWGQLNVDLVETSFVGSVVGPLNVSLPVSQVVVEELDLDGGFLGLRIGDAVQFC